MSEPDDPCDLHQICIVSGFDLPSQMPETISENIESLKAAHAGSTHRLWSGNELRAMIAAEFPADVLAAFDALGPYSYKCDLGRLCVLHRYGGLYADLGMRFVAPLQPPASIGLAAFRSLSFLTDSWTTVSNGVIWSRMGRRETAIAIDLIVENCRRRFYGSHPLCPTGPVLFGHAIAKAAAERDYGEPIDQWIGEVRPSAATPLELCLVTPARQVVAINMKRGRSMAELGLAGANAYQRAWLDRTTYGDDGGPRL